MGQTVAKLRPGDWVEVKSSAEILETLDGNGALDQLPFMPEMAAYCGRRFRVLRRVVKVCASGMKTGSTLRGFETDDVILLEGLRCSGADHDGCQKACTIFWKEAWLRKVSDASEPAQPTALGLDSFKRRLKSKSGPETYFCQASELLRVTRELTKRERYTRWINDIRAGNCSAFEMAQRFGIFLYWKMRRTLFGPYGRGTNKATPSGTLHLMAGDHVVVKPMDQITATLDAKASNRGLWFSPNMRLLCGQNRSVEKRIEKLIVDGSGEMRQLRDTVFLEGSFCSCAHIAFGGCSRGEYVYWREVWLDRTGEGQ